jgi:hypothetical protein
MSCRENRLCLDTSRLNSGKHLYDNAFGLECVT